MVIDIRFETFGNRLEIGFASEIAGFDSRRLEIGDTEGREDG